jgi:hypothetical protein
MRVGIIYNILQHNFGHLLPPLNLTYHPKNALLDKVKNILSKTVMVLKILLI